VTLTHNLFIHQKVEAMKRSPLTVYALLLSVVAFALLTTAAAAQSIELRLSDGSRWRGEVGNEVKLTVQERNVQVEYTGRIVSDANLYLQIEGNFVGGRTRIVMKADIISIETIQRDRDRDRAETRRQADAKETDAKADASASGPGVIVLPLKGMVGLEIRVQEFRRILREADRLGRGQIIVLELNTGGGSMGETFQIGEVMEQLRERHRVIAWVRSEAFSAGCAIASMCNEIYFTRDGAAGAMTAFSPATMQSLDEEGLEMWLREAGRWMQWGNRSPYIAHAMIVADRELSYDIDPETGRVTFHPNLSGQYVLSHKGSNLTLTAHHAVQSGFANGIANSEAELARLLDLPKWNEVSDIGRRMHQEWVDTVERAQDRVPRLIHEMQRGVPGDAVANMSHQLRIIRELIRWWDRAPNAMSMIGIPSKSDLEAQERELQHRIAQARRQR
jgi:hypothetical protein